ncbi:small GTP-binding protein, putative [Trichomonas vaginalis G3]|uniref:Small GTP-binding protein, putative n=1 Tax=Trichomonas vaginalis (strain ATCC PRA-98 / G3) TaxID=412133 RepID=A2EGF8_TRIV3|nr:GTPase protein [Trichomonas vaginalis G3]EAY08241.1 small GTP-binding protein, putative [Trichomonas vaginalis G3]KAI5507521.1 GTPase protein [Trichomonas vaginalis G3]|eukprot:XP_001320464.1 small GTP-binding protein [Trichomonas vaginalis G3]
MPEKIIHILMLGADYYGKLAITLRFVKGSDDEMIPTLEDTFQKNISVDGETFVCETTVTPNGEDAEALILHLIKQSDAFGIVYSVDDKFTFDYISKLYDDIVRIKKTKNPPCVIFANKCELPAPHAVPIEDAKAKSSRSWNNTEIIEVSKNQNDNINKGFEKICRLALKQNNSKDSSNGYCEIL